MAERKKYIEIEAPFLRDSIRALGDPEELDGKTIKLDLTRKMRGKGLGVKLRIFNKDGKLYAVPNRLDLSISYIRKMMRKRTDYVEDSFHARCSDIKVVVKPMLITRKKVSRAVRKNLRNTVREFITEYIKNKTFIEVCEEIMDGTLQKTMLPKLKKVYPLSFNDLRVFETKEIEKIDLDSAIIEKESLVQEEPEEEEKPEEQVNVENEKEEE